MAAATFNNPPLPLRITHFPPNQFPHQRSPLLRYNSAKGEWEKPYEYLPTGKKAYLDEQDVVTFLDPQVSASCNPAAYLWLISSAWEIAGTRYAYPNLTKRSASKLLCTNDHGVTSLEYYHYRTSGGPMPISWINSFQKAIFSSTDGNIYGRFIGGSFLAGLANSFSPLRFTVRQLKEVMPTEQPSGLAYVFGDGLFDLQEYPEGFPRPGIYFPIYPMQCGIFSMGHSLLDLLLDFNRFTEITPMFFSRGKVVVYVHHLGPGVSVGQAWQEGKKLQQVPQKLCSDILRVKNYSALRENQ
ncbi:hypothetical protein D8674_018957 [Pyrus ussuriensis x Pyrus communis]|uniref:Uncharacterized protein n=1 Tax=Pyrus ussuriensis x Pyrus communis TaxID=2448454 RepID=A0A5N5G686_9ROSA|nr:hypothetical protein D8674_018957 [Pyrus ussuriensis x Pyrus communis]